jgi:hypothetical protein
MRDVVWAALVVLCVPIWAWIVATRGYAVVEALRARRDLRRHRQLQKAKRPIVDYDLIARLEVELGFEKPPPASQPTDWACLVREAERRHNESLDYDRRW